MMAGRTKIAIIASLWLAGSLTMAQADNVWGPSPNSLSRQIDRSSGAPDWRNHGNYRDGYRINVRSEGGHYSYAYRQRDIVGGNGLPSYVDGVGTFAGGLSAVRFRNNGIYFYAENLGGDGNMQPRPKAKIIDVTPATAKSACAMEHGVCIVRGTP